MAVRIKQARVRVAQRVHDARGFTLVEVMVATLVMVLLSTIVFSALPVAAHVMRQSTMVANSATLSQSVNTALQDLLRYSSVRIEDDAVVAQQLSDGRQTPTFVNSDHTGPNAAYVDYPAYLQADGVIQWVNADTGVKTPVPHSKGIYTDFLIKRFTLTYDRDAKVFSGSYIIESRDGAFTSEPYTFSCRPLVPEVPAG